MDNESKFELQEYFIFHNNSINKFSICKTNQEIIIKSNNYEAKLAHKFIENLTNTKYDTIEKEYNFLVYLFQTSAIRIKDIIMNKSIILSFEQNNQTKEIILSYNNESKSIMHYELNCEFKNLMSDIAQIKKEVHEIHDTIHNNIDKNKNIEDNKNNIFEPDTKEFELYKKFVIDSALNSMNDQINKQINFSNELEKKCNEYTELAKSQLKEGNKNKAKSYLITKKKYIDKMNKIEGIISFIQEEIFILEETKGIQEVVKTIKNGLKLIQEANKGLNNDEAFKKLMQDEKNTNKELDDFFNDNLQNSEEEKKEEGVKEKGKKEEEKEDKNVKKEQENKKEEGKKEEDKKKEKQNLDDNEQKFNEYKQEGLKILKDGILSIIFANEGINLEGLKRIKDNLNDIRKNHDKINEFFKLYAKEDEEEVEKNLEMLENEMNEV